MLFTVFTHFDKNFGNISVIQAKIGRDVDQFF